MKVNTGAVDTTEPDRLIAYPELQRLVGDASRWTIRRWQTTEGFPAPVSVGGRTLFSERAIQRWIAARLANPLKLPPRGRLREAR